MEPQQVRDDRKEAGDGVDLDFRRRPSRSGFSRRLTGPLSPLRSLPCACSPGRRPAGSRLPGASLPGHLLPSLRRRGRRPARRCLPPWPALLRRFRSAARPRPALAAAGGL